MKYIFLGLFCPLFLLGQTAPQITPGQIGLFGTTNGAFLRANSANNSAEWMPSSTLQGGLFLPSGASGNTLRHDGASWLSNNNLYNTGNFVGIGTTNPQTKLHVHNEGNDGFLMLSGYDSEMRVGGNGSRSAMLVLDSYSNNIPEVITKFVPSGRSTFLLELYGAEINNRFSGTSGIVRTQSDNPFYQKVWNSGGLIEYGYIGRTNGQAFTDADFVWLYQYKKDGSFYNKVFGAGLNDIGIHYMTQSNTAGLGAMTKYYTNSNVAPDFMGATGFLFRGGTTDGNKQFVVHVSDANTPKVVVTGHVPPRLGVGVAVPAAELHLEGGFRATSLSGTGTRLAQVSAAGDLQPSTILSSDVLTAATTFNGDINGPSQNLQIIANAVTTAEIATGAVQTSDILDGTIQGIDVANEGLTGADILDGSIQGNDIANASVGLAKIEPGIGTAIAGNYSTWGSERFVRVDANAASRTVTFNDAMVEGVIYFIRCTNNGTNSVTFGVGTGVTGFGVDQNSTLALTSLAVGGAGTGVEAPFKIYQAVRFGSVVWVL